MDHGEISHISTHKMHQSMPCDHTDCGFGCLTPEASSKAQLFLKSVHYLDLDQPIDRYSYDYLHLRPLRTTDTGPPHYLHSKLSTPVNRRDLLLE